MRPLPRTSNRLAFTLVELLVVIGVIAVLISILLPTLNRARESGKNVTCRSNLCQIGIALKMYANDNRDHFPTPEACGDGSTVSTAANFRRGIDEPDPTNPDLKETLGLHNMLYRRGYCKAKEVWKCPSYAGRLTTYVGDNSYAWNVTKTIAGYTSLQRGRVPVNSLGVQSPASWWYVQDNVGIVPFNTNVPKTVDVAGVFGNFWYLPHQYRTKQVVSAAVTGRQGSSNVLFYDGAVGYFVYQSQGNTAVQSVIRGE